VEWVDGEGEGQGSGCLVAEEELRLSLRLIVCCECLATTASICVEKLNGPGRRDMGGRQFFLTPES
jgi:hypothetical protein